MSATVVFGIVKMAIIPATWDMYDLIQGVIQVATLIVFFILSMIYILS